MLEENNDFHTEENNGSKKLLHLNGNFGLKLGTTRVKLHHGLTFYSRETVVFVQNNL